MSRLLLVCLSAIMCCLVSCTDKEKIPKGILGKEKMQQVMLDMIQAERFRDNFIQDSDSSKDPKAETFKLYAQVFEINKITKDEFVKSYKFYMSRPDIAREVFDSMATEANHLRENLYKPKALDTAATSKTDTLSSIDSSKAATADSAKLKAGTDSAKKVTPAPVAAPPVQSTIAPATLDARRAAFKRMKRRDTLLRYNKTKP